VTGEANEYRKRKLSLEAENEKLLAKIEEWQQRYDKEVADAAKRMQALLLKQFTEKEEAKAERKKEQEVVV